MVISGVWERKAKLVKRGTWNVDSEVTYKLVPGQLVGAVYNGLPGPTPVQMPDAWF